MSTDTIISIIISGLLGGWLGPKMARWFYWGEAREKIREKDRLDREKFIRKLDESRRKRRERRERRRLKRENSRREREEQKR